MEYTIKDGWVIDSDNNRCRLSKWGSESKAIEVLKSLKDCSDCSDCSGCYDCSRCLRCSGCSGCSDCSDCSGCYDCSDCSHNAEAAPCIAIDNIHQRVYEAASQAGALAMKKWHTCDTAHCRAGWIVVLAGDAGKKLESKTSTLFAAMQIYKASGYEISPCRFYDSNEEALADMKRLAET